MDRPPDVIYEAMREVIDGLRRDAGYDLRAATLAERKRFIAAFATVLVREARKHGKPHDKGEPCVFSARGRTTVSLAATRLLADRIRRRHSRTKSIWLHRPDRGQMFKENQRQLTERPIEVALRKAGRRVPPHTSGRRWDRTHGGFAAAIENALLDSEQLAKDPWRNEVDYTQEWQHLPPAADGRVTRKGDFRAIENAKFVYEVTRHLLSSVAHGPAEHEDRADEDIADLAEQIRRKYFENLGAKARQIDDIESRLWVEVGSGGLPPGS
jgi:hypothetical protein